MKFFNIFMGIIGVIIIIFIISLFFPRQYKIERSTVINKPLYATFAYMNNIKNWSDWSPWNEDLDSSFVKFYSPNVTGLNATQYFRGGLLGIGRFKITQSKTNEMLTYNLHLNFKDAELQSAATFYFKNIGGVKTQLSWVDSGDVGINPLNRFMLPSKVKSTGDAFDKGLVEIKRSAEKY